MIPVIAVSGLSGAGKTTLMEKLIAEFAKRGLTVAAIKHHHGEMEMDNKGKDTSRHKQAGARAVVLAASGGLALIKDAPAEMAPVEIAEEFLWDADLVLAEGYKNARIPKIAIVDPDNEESVEIAKGPTTIAVVCKKEIDIQGMKRFHPDDATAIADYIGEKFIEPDKSPKTRLMVDGKPIPMKPFVRDLVGEVIRGMVGTFKGVEDAKKIVIITEK